MAVIIGSRKTQRFIYDFAVNGGAISSINMGIFIPGNAIIVFGYAKVTTGLTSAGSATIAVGYAGSTGALISATAVASWTPAGTILPGVDLNVDPVELTAIQQLQVTIATAALTAGQFVYCVEYDEWSI